jgi:predicted molibdopterin-dependent oxidoreductase YjgC
MEILEATGSEIRALYVMGENPAFKLPNSPRVRDALTALDLLVVQDIFLSETARLADVVLPAQAWSEREGTITNIERRIQRTRKAVAPRCGKADWQIVGAVASAMDHPMGFATAGEIMDELVQVSPLYSGLSQKNLDGEGWLVRPEDVAYVAELSTPPIARVLPKKESNGANLGVDRMLFHSGTTTRHAPALLQICSEAKAKVGLGLASEIGLVAGDRVRLSTARGRLTVPVEIDPSICERRVLLSNHFEGHGVFDLLGYEIDPVTKAAGLDGCEVSIEKDEGVVE